MGQLIRSVRYHDSQNTWVFTVNGTVAGVKIQSITMDFIGKNQERQVISIYAVNNKRERMLFREFYNMSNLDITYDIEGIL